MKVSVGGKSYIFYKAISDYYGITSLSNNCIVLSDESQSTDYTINAYVIDNNCENHIGECFGVNRRDFAPINPTINELNRWIQNQNLGIARPVIIEAINMVSNGEEYKDIPIPDTDDPSQVIAEMRSLVDVDRLQNLISVAINSDSLAPKRAERRAAEAYLDMWARNKYRLYLLFGRKLKIERDIKIAVDADVVIDKLRDISVSEKYNKYYPGLRYIWENIEPEAIKNNTLTEHSFYDAGIQNARDLCGKQKITTLIHAMFEDEQLDAEIAKIYQDGHLDKKIAISIDPYDYLTMSENLHGWKSCHNIHIGSYGGGAFSYMTDGATAIAYMYDGSESYKYRLNGFSFKGNSKEWRQCVYIASNNRAAIFSRNYPRVIDDVLSGVEDMYASLFEDGKKFITTSCCGSRNVPGYVQNSMMPYHDVTAGSYNYDLMVPDKMATDPKFVVGGDTICCECGCIIESMSHKRMLCDSCYEDRYNGRDDEEY